MLEDERLSDEAPVAFFSYSHDSDDHKSWALKLATRLRSDGVDIVLDQWDLNLGADIARFMEQGVSKSPWFIAICTPRYVAKADAGDGGSGYEKTILTASLMRSANEKQVIPIWRDNPERILPIFVGPRLAADFTNESKFEDQYAALLRTLHGIAIVPKPPLGKNPFAARSLADPEVAFLPTRYVDPNIKGHVEFDYSNNNGMYIIGCGDYEFRTRWSRSGNGNIYTYKNPGISTVAIVDGLTELAQMGDVRSFDTSSDLRIVQTSEFVVLKNNNGYFAVLRIVDIKSRLHGKNPDVVVFDYWIEPNRSVDFSRLP